jgi:hypothetical protein
MSSEQPNDADWELAIEFGRCAGGVDSSLLASFFARHRLAAVEQEREACAKVLLDKAAQMRGSVTGDMMARIFEDEAECIRSRNKEGSGG